MCTAEAYTLHALSELFASVFLHLAHSESADTGMRWIIVYSSQIFIKELFFSQKYIMRILNILEYYRKNSWGTERVEMLIKRPGTWEQETQITFFYLIQDVFSSAGII